MKRLALLPLLFVISGVPARADVLFCALSCVLSACLRARGWRVGMSGRAAPVGQQHQQQQ